MLLTIKQFNFDLINLMMMMMMILEMAMTEIPKPPNH